MSHDASFSLIKLTVQNTLFVRLVSELSGLNLVDLFALFNVLALIRGSGTFNRSMIGDRALVDWSFGCLVGNRHNCTLNCVELSFIVSISCCR